MVVVQGALLQEKQPKNKNKTKTRIPFKWILSKDIHYTLLRCDTKDHLEEKLGGNRNILPKHRRLPGICETTGLRLILHSTLETGKCGHDLTFKSTLHLVRELYEPFLKKKKGRIINLCFPW